MSRPLNHDCRTCLYYAPQPRKPAQGACLHPDVAIARTDDAIEAYPRVWSCDRCSLWTARARIVTRETLDLAPAATTTP